MVLEADGVLSELLLMKISMVCPSNFLFSHLLSRFFPYFPSLSSPAFVHFLFLPAAKLSIPKTQLGDMGKR
jgi:hypothetical protein